MEETIRNDFVFMVGWKVGGGWRRFRLGSLLERILIQTAKIFPFQAEFLLSNSVQLRRRFSAEMRSGLSLFFSIYAASSRAKLTSRISVP